MPDPPANGQNGDHQAAEQQQQGKQYARSGKIKCHKTTEVSIPVNKKGQLSWPFVSRADRI